MLKIGHFRLEKIHISPRTFIAFCKKKQNVLLYISMFFVCCLFTRDYYYRPSYSTPLRTITEIQNLVEENTNKNSLKTVIGYNIEDNEDKYTLERRKAFRWFFLISQAKIYKFILDKSDFVLNDKMQIKTELKTKLQAIIFWVFYGIFLFLIFVFIEKTMRIFSSNKFQHIYFCYFTYLFCLYFILGRKEGGGYNYNVFETVFISMAFYFSIVKNKFLYSLTCILAPLVRESGFLVSIFYTLLNSKKSIIKNKNTYFFPAISLISMLFVNYDIILDMLNPQFLGFFGTQGTYITIIDLFKDSTGLNDLFNGLIELFYSYILFFVPLLIFYNSKTIQKRIGFIIGIYFIIFALTTPIDQLGIRFLLVPMMSMYIYIGINDKVAIKN